MVEFEGVTDVRCWAIALSAHHHELNIVSHGNDREQEDHDASQYQITLGGGDPHDSGLLVQEEAPGGHYGHTEHQPNEIEKQFHNGQSSDINAIILNLDELCPPCDAKI